MILVVFGTTGELIKLAPVLVRLRERDGRYLLATTGQQVRQIPPLLESFGLPQPDLWLGRSCGRDLRMNRDIPAWLARVLGTYSRRRGSLRSALRRGAGRPLVLVHGDTMTTVLGAAMGRLLRVPVAHIESGLRSFDLLHPFPEELNRRTTSALARIHYAPGAWAAGNLKRRDVVDTGSNTVRDSLALCSTMAPPPELALPERYGVVSLHRFELLNNRPLLEWTVTVLAEHARETPLLWVDHPVTIAALESFGLRRSFDDERLVRIPRVGFCSFVSLMRRSSFLVTDSGGSQEESFYLDLPCLVHRKRTERREGLGENVVLSGYRDDVVAAFLDEPGRHRRRSELPAHSPADVIVADLVSRGFV